MMNVVACHHIVTLASPGVARFGPFTMMYTPRSLLTLGPLLAVCAVSSVSGPVHAHGMTVSRGHTEVPTDSEKQVATEPSTDPTTETPPAKVPGLGASVSLGPVEARDPESEMGESTADVNKQQDSESGQDSSVAATAETHDGPASAATTTPAPSSVGEGPKPGSKWRPAGESDKTSRANVDNKAGHYKPGTGLTIASKDGRFLLATRLRAQFRYTLNSDEEQLQHGFQIRRARVQFKGHMFSKDVKFKTELAFSPKDLGFDGTPHRTPLLTWYTELAHLRDLTVRMGQYKLPFSRQRVISSGNLQMVDRSIANGEFNIDRDIGLDIRSKDFLGLGKLKYYAGVYMGEGRDVSAPSNFEMLYLARVEVLPLGLFKDYSEADFARTKPRLALGAAYAYHDGALNNRGVIGKTPTDGGTTDFHIATADFLFKAYGFSATGEAFVRDGTRNFGTVTMADNGPTTAPAENEDVRRGFGWHGQAGYLIPRLPLEFAGRYSQVRSYRTSSLSDRDSAGGAVSWYFSHHPLKVQADFFHQWQANQASDHFRVQFQAAF